MKDKTATAKHTPDGWPAEPPPMSYASLLSRPNGHDSPMVSDEYRRRWSAHAGLVAALETALTPLDALADGRPDDAAPLAKDAARIVAAALAKAEL